LNNRAFAFKLKLKNDLCGVKKGQDCLFLYGVGNQTTVEGVKDLEKETGLKAVALLNNGGNHHILLGYWYEAFPDMKIWVCPTRAYNTKNQQELRKKYPERWELADNTSTEHHVHQLLHYFGSGADLQVDCVLFDQAYIHGDAVEGVWRDPTGAKWLTNTDVFTVLPKLENAKDDLSDETVFFYKPLKLAITGHHYEVGSL
jgi:hypothetical protein